MHICLQRGYLSSRDILLNSIFGEANADNAGATLVWDWIAWPTDDSGYSFDVWSDGSNAMHAQIEHMNGKVRSLLAYPEGLVMLWTPGKLLVAQLLL